MSAETATPTPPGGWRMPAEWEPHESTLMAWPARADLWGPHVAAAEDEYAGVAEAIARFEPVVMVAPPERVDEVQRRLGATARVVGIPLDDSWVRDSGPIGVLDSAGRRAGVDFVFNSWGEKFLPYDADAALAEGLLAELGIDRIPSPMVLEGGAISVDGAGTLLTTEQCLLNPNRNPDMTREQIEAELGARLGVSRVVWLPHGHLEDPHTDGHVDCVAAFTGPGSVLALACGDEANPNAARMRANLDVLASASDAAGRALDVTELDLWPYFELGGERYMVSYLNYYVANGGVVVPTAGLPSDAEALEVIGAAHPGREVVGVPARIVTFGGGGPHCITQQVPAVAPQPAAS